LPAHSRHLAVHDSHLVGINTFDQPFVTGDVLARLGLASDAKAQRTRLSQLEERGVTEVAYQPAGPDIPRELHAFAVMAGLQPRADASVG
jgi:5,10-methylenetetrahydromethanopterin reductase